MHEVVSIAALRQTGRDWSGMFGCCRGMCRRPAYYSGKVVSNYILCTRNVLCRDSPRNHVCSSMQSVGQGGEQGVVQECR